MNWQQSLSESFKSPEALLDYLGLDARQVSLDAALDFPFRVTRCYAERMIKGDAADPLLRQVLPVEDELNHALQGLNGALDDPVGDLDAVRGGGLLHKYRGRALMLGTGSCAVHCRYCFRRNFPYEDYQYHRSAKRHLLTFLEDHPDLDEIILSGGDPLTLSDNRLAELLLEIDQRPQIRRLRIHSRFPMILPSRVTPELLGLLSSLRSSPVWVLHANHPRELDQATLNALQALRRAGVQMLNQSVLLKGVNDDANVLAALSRCLFDEGGVLPYYLHQLDRAKGVMHFEVPDATAIRIHQDLQAMLPGYLVPRLVREQAGKPCKMPLV